MNDPIYRLILSLIGRSEKGRGGIEIEEIEWDELNGRGEERRRGSSVGKREDDVVLRSGMKVIDYRSTEDAGCACKIEKEI